MMKRNLAKKGIAIMREFHSKENISKNTSIVLESLKDAAIKGLSSRDSTVAQQSNLISVLLRTAYHVGRSKK